MTKQLFPSTVSHYLLVGTMLLAAVTYWAPWVDHHAAALKLTGQDMGEFVKFLPRFQEIAQGERRGQWPALRIPRELFYASPFVCTICLMILAANKHLVYPRWLRVTALVSAALLLLGLLPPVWGHPRDLFAGEFRLQGYALILGLVLVAGHGLFHAMPLYSLALMVSILSLLALTTSQGAFWLIRSRLWAVYNTPTLSLGWGLWLHIAAWATAVGLGVYIHQQAKVRQTSPSGHLPQNEGDF
jgi:hypothetical protein